MNIHELSKLIDAETSNKYFKIKVSSFKTNTKELKKNDIFIAINNGHKYLSEIKKCKAVIVENDFKSDKFPVLKVKNTTEALNKIAIYKRLNYKGKVIAVTGSNGKTTTKELLSHILKSKYKVFKSYKNMNNNIGVPLNLLSLDDSEFAVFELGMNHKGEISFLSKLVKPDISIVTNIGTAHIGNFNNQKDIYKAKMEILDGMPEKKLFVNGDDKYLKTNNIAIKVTLKNDLFEISNIKEFPDYILFDLKIDKIYHIKYKIPSKTQLSNVALAIYVALYLKIKPNKIALALNNFKPLENRLEIIKLKNKIVINDAYNSNYESLIAGLEILKNYNLNKICIIGAILEIGSKENEIYKKISKKLNDEYEYIFIGNNMKAKKGIYLKDVNELINYYQNNKEMFNNKVIYIKGSNGVKLIDFVNELTA